MIVQARITREGGHAGLTASSCAKRYKIRRDGARYLFGEVLLLQSVLSGETKSSEDSFLTVCALRYFNSHGVSSVWQRAAWC